MGFFIDRDEYAQWVLSFLIIRLCCGYVYANPWTYLKVVAFAIKCFNFHKVLKND